MSLESGSRNLGKFWAFILLSIGVLAALASGYITYWTDSEIWPTVASRYMFSGDPEYSFFSKPLFHLLLFGNHKLTMLFGLHPMDLARGWMVLNSLGTLTAVFLILRRLASRERAILALAFLVSLSFFIKRSGEVRSDLVASHLLLWAVWAHVVGLRYKHFLNITLCLVALLITPKSIFWMACLVPVFRPPLKGLSLIALATATLTAFVWRDNMGFFLASFTEDAGVPYFDLVRLQFLGNFVRENPHFVFAFLLTVWFWWQDRKSTAESEIVRHIRQTLPLFLLLLAVYPDRLPFMIASLLPFFTLIFFSVRPAYTFSSPIRTFVTCVTFLLTLHWSLTTIVSHSSRPQRKFAFWLQSQLDQLPPIAVFDPVGIIPIHLANNWFLGPAQIEKNIYVTNYLKRDKPEVILYATKLTYLRPHIDHFLEAEYHHDRAGIFVRKLVWLRPGTHIEPAELRRRLQEEFPRFEKLRHRDWIVRLKDESGIELSRPLPANVLNGDQPIAIPPHAEQIALMPFELRIPFNVNIPGMFEFDARF